MDRTDRKKQWFWMGLILISVLYTLYYVLFLYRISLDMPIRGRHVVKFLFIVLVYGAGVSCLRKWGMPWMMLPGTPGAHIMIPINNTPLSNHAD